MRIEVGGEGVLVSWNRDNPAVRSAKRGVLEIEDGSQGRTVQLEPPQLDNGSLLYQPSTSDINFRLTIYGNDGSSLTDGVRLLEGPKQIATAQGKGKGHAGPLIRVEKNDSQTANTAGIGSGRVHPKRLATAAVEQTPTAEVGRPVSKLREQDVAREQTKAAPTDLVARQPPEKLNVQAPDTPPIAAPSPAPVHMLHVKSLQTYVPPRPIKTVMLNAALFEPSLLAGIERIEIQVDIDESGHVTGARPLHTPGDISPLVTAAVVSTAKQWTFEPAKIGGQNIAAKHTISFRIGKP